MQTQRQQSSLFLGKHGAVTSRDLIKCGKRKPQSALEVAKHAYKLLAEKLRSPDEQQAVEAIINKACNVKLDIEHLYDSNELSEIQEQLRQGSLSVEGVLSIGITSQMKRMWQLVCDCLDNAEPGLLVGETSTGKTTICQLYAAKRGQR